VITTSQDHNLSTGGVVRIHVPKTYGMFQLNNNLYSVTVLSPTTFSLQYSQYPQYLNVNSTQYPTFSVPSNPQFTAEVLSVGSGPTSQTALPWQVTNNTFDSTLKDQTYNNSTSEIPF
jgi:hypothetical protein